MLGTSALIPTFAALPTSAIAQTRANEQPAAAKALLPEPAFVARAIDIATRDVTTIDSAR